LPVGSGRRRSRSGRPPLHPVAPLGAADLQGVDHPSADTPHRQADRPARERRPRRRVTPPVAGGRDGDGALRRTIRRPARSSARPLPRLRPRRKGRRL
jgi:hypothetical protein